MTEVFNPHTPITLPVCGFGAGRRVRIVGVCTGNRFHVNLNSASDTVFHLNPRFDEKCVVRNSTRYGIWQKEERYSKGFPFVHGKTFTLDLVAQPGFIQVLLNGKLFTHFVERDDPHQIRSVKVEEGIQIHSITVS